jgi:hypothetical protein
LDIIIILFTVLTVFAIDNKEFFDTVEDLKEEGYTWQYTGKEAWKDTGNNPALLIESYKGDKAFTYWKIGE